MMTVGIFGLGGGCVVCDKFVIIMYLAPFVTSRLSAVSTLHITAGILYFGAKYNIPAGIWSVEPALV